MSLSPKASLCASLLVVGLLGPGLSSIAAHAQTFEGEGATGVLQGLGLYEEEKPDIEFKERGPLAIPPSRELPPPRGAVAVDRADWPNDPDEARKKVANTQKLWEEQMRSGRLLTQKEMSADVLPPGAAKSKPGLINDRARVTLMPSELAGGHKLLAKEESWAGKEPERRVLSDPPSGYRAPSATTAYAPAPGKGPSFWDKINPFRN